MNNPNLSVRELQENDIEHIIQYWLEADESYMKGMGVDTSKIPGREQWKEMLQQQLGQGYEEKQSYCIIWLADGKPVGHSNINKIKFGEEAYMHLHLWKPGARQKGWGTAFVKMTIPYFFRNYRLKKLYCEPYALNMAPHKTMKKLGFEFINEYITTPGWINFEQPVKLWMMSDEQ